MTEEKLNDDKNKDEEEVLSSDDRPYSAFTCAILQWVFPQTLPTESYRKK